jgi:uncharacterized protein (DUF2225 family)
VAFKGEMPDNILLRGWCMKRREFLALSLTVPITGATSKAISATTWAKQEFNCPVCTTKNTFRVVMSYGSYIYGWPSKYQLIYWPVTDANSVYCCKKCYLSLFMWDYEDLAKDKIPGVKKQLEGARIDKAFDDYAKVPMSQRLEIAEKVYPVLDMKDEFWCRFYRILGYHYSYEKNGAKAAEARNKALNVAQKMLNDKSNQYPAKELWVISGAMKHFLKDDKGAVADLEKALTVKYQDKELNEEKSNNGERNLNALVKEYLEKIKDPKPPRDGPQ